MLDISDINLLYTGVFIALLIYFSFYKIFDYLRKNHEDIYEQIGSPKWYGMRYNYRVFFGLMFGKLGLPDDFEIKAYVWILRITYTAIIVFAILALLGLHLL
ncbi:hypothetical protein JW868_04290 [Candidatus Woesearchaeota archaeon]|nr:hypothetical protein [Candidatus Woesearchaeota archaeon]